MELQKGTYQDLPETTELELLRQSLCTVKGAVWIELGCGDAKASRTLAEELPHVQIYAYEVDEVQYDKNMSMAASCPPNISFGKAGMQDFTADDESVDAVIMLKSLHHVPFQDIPAGFDKVKQSLKPGGKLFINEPVFKGDFNDILRLFHDEEQVRSQAFDILKGQVESGEFTLEKEIHFQNRIKYPRGFADFEESVLGSTFNHFHLTDDVLKTVKERFQQHVRDDGSAEFLMPTRADILVKK